jgi:hypothetical protein
VGVGVAHFTSRPHPGAARQIARMTFERAALQAKLRAKLRASALIRGGLALGLKRRAKGGCGGISRPSLFLPSLRTPLTAEWAALALLTALALLGALGRLGKPSELSDYRATVSAVGAFGGPLGGLGGPWGDLGGLRAPARPCPAP